MTATEYLEKREALIPLAESYANRKADRETNRAAWDAAFLGKMQEMAVKGGLVEARYLSALGECSANPKVLKALGVDKSGEIRA